MEHSLKLNKNYNIKVFIEKRVEEIKIPIDATITELGKLIYDKYLLSNFNYTILYRNKKLLMKDVRKVSYFFDKEPNPFIFLINNKLLSPDCKESCSVFLTTNLNERSIKEIVEKFFEYKSLPFNVNIKLLMEHKYRIRFTKPVLANEFIQFYNIFNSRKLNNKIELGLNLPKIKIKKSTSSEYILDKSSRENALDNVKKRNAQDSLITARSVKTGMDLLHPSYFKQMNTSQNINKNNNKNKKIKIKLIKNKYKGIFKLPFLNPDERYYREQYLDKKNWISKKGFCPCIGNYKMGGSGCNFISNYVAATPSESPLNHNFREVNKTKWINKRGFFT